MHRAAVLLGRKGGRATARALTPEQRRAIALHAVRTRWARYYERNPDRRAKVA
jgi:hypothetical protein